MPFMPFSLWQPCIHLNCVLHNHYRRESFHLRNSSSMNKRRKERWGWGERRRQWNKEKRGRVSEPSKQIDKKWVGEGIRGKGQVSAYTLDPIARLQKSEVLHLFTKQYYYSSRTVYWPRWVQCGASAELICGSMSVYVSYVLAHMPDCPYVTGSHFKTLWTNLHWLCAAATSKWPC